MANLANRPLLGRIVKLKAFVKQGVKGGTLYEPFG